MNNCLNLNNLKILRKKTGVSIIECKNALIKSNYNLILARKFLFKQVVLLAKKKLYREILETVFFTFSDIFVFIELNCETKFVADNPKFCDLAQSLALNLLYSQKIKHILYSSYYFNIHKNYKYIAFDDISITKIDNIKKSDIFLIQKSLNSSEDTIEFYLLEKISIFGENIEIFFLFSFKI